jgi:Flp pilus assembly protein TadG
MLELDLKSLVSDVAPTRSTGNSGQSLVEFALVAPIFFLVMFSIIELGLLLGAQNGLVNSVREAARYAATYRVASRADAIAACKSDLVGKQLTQDLAGSIGIPGFDAGAPLSRTIIWRWVADPTANDYLVQIQVSATYGYPLFVPIASAILDPLDGNTDGRLTISAQEQMRIENRDLTFATAPADVTWPTCT